MGVKPVLVAGLSPLRYPAWQGAYEATLQTTDTNALFKLVEIAEANMRVRRDFLTRRETHRRERQAIQKALRALLAIKRSRLKFFS
jgi:hypothetical protein